MFNFFKKKPDLNLERKRFIEEMTRPIAYASALISLVDEYPTEMKRRNITCPIYKCKNISIVELWNYMTIEANINSVRFGTGSIIDLADISKQEELLNSFVKEKSYLYYPQPSGTNICNSIQGMWQAYIYISEAGTSVCDQMTDKYALSQKKRTIVSDLEDQAVTALQGWNAIKIRNNRNSTPKTLFELFYQDITLKTKSIALSKFFGPFISEGMRDFERKIEIESGPILARKQAKVHDVLRTSTTPDEAFQFIDKIFREEEGPR